VKKKIEVLNAGRGSYSPIIYWRKIKYLIENVGLQFEQLVVFIDISDAEDETLRYLSNNDVILKTPPTPPIIKRLKIFIYDNTTVIYPMLSFLNTPFKERPSEKDGGIWSSLISFNYISSKWTLDENVYNTFGKEGNLLMKKYMNKLLKLLRNNNIDLTIAVYPYPSQVWYEDLNSSQVNIWEKWSQENNVKFINYFPDFIIKGLNKTEKLKTLEKYYIPGDVHFNKEGNRVIANKFIQTYLYKE